MFTVVTCILTNKYSVFIMAFIASLMM